MDIQTEAFMAQNAAYVALVRALHEYGALPIQKLVDQMEEMQDFSSAAFGAKENPISVALLGSLKEIADAYSQFRPPQSGSPDSDA